MAGPIDGLKAAWKDPKKRPWIIAGGGAAAGAGFLALRRPEEPDDQAAEDAEAEELPVLPVENAVGVGALPPVFSFPSPPGDGFAETDFSPLFAEIDALGASVDEQLTLTFEDERQRSRQEHRQQAARLKRQQARLKKQRQIQKRQAKRITRLQQRMKKRQRRARARRRARKKKARR